MEESQEIKQESAEVKAVKKDLGDYMAVEGLAQTEGGKVLVNSLVDSICSNVESILSLVKSPELELRCAVMKLASNLNMYRILKRAPENARLAKEELSKLLEEDKN